MTKTIKLQDQNKILEKHFGITVAIPPSRSHGLYLIPSWQKIAKTYPEALQKVLDAIESTRPLYNWRKGQINEKHIRRMSKDIPEILDVELGQKYKGKSVEKVRSIASKNEYLLGAYEVGIILLTHPETLKSYDDLWIDCAGDEFAPGDDGDFSCAPFFGWHDGGVKFAAEGVGGAVENFGAASGSAPQLNLDTGVLEPSESLTLESAIELVKENGYQVSKIL